MWHTDPCSAELPIISGKQQETLQTTCNPWSIANPTLYGKPKPCIHLDIFVFPNSIKSSSSSSSLCFHWFHIERDWYIEMVRVICMYICTYIYIYIYLRILRVCRELGLLLQKQTCKTWYNSQYFSQCKENENFIWIFFFILNGFGHYLITYKKLLQFFFYSLCQNKEKHPQLSPS